MDGAARRGAAGRILLAAIAVTCTAAGRSAAQTTPAVISTIGGSGAFCQDPAGMPPTCGDGGPFIAAQFDSPRGLTLTPSGALLIADRYDQRNRMIPTVAEQATISTIAGTGAQCTPTSGTCGDGGAENQAHLTIPRPTALTPDGGYVIADEGDHRIRKVTFLSATGIISTVAGTGNACPLSTDPRGHGGPATAAQLNFPHEVVVLPNVVLATAAWRCLAVNKRPAAELRLS